jgi:hypothetical protein
MSAGEEVDFSNVYLTKSSAADYEELCSLDVLGLKDHLEQDQQFVYKEFQEQLTQRDGMKLVCCGSLVMSYYQAMKGTV